MKREEVILVLIFIKRYKQNNYFQNLYYVVKCYINNILGGNNYEIKITCKYEGQVRRFKKSGNLTENQKELLEELIYLDRNGMLGDSKKFYESVSLSSSSCSACGRPY